MIQPVIRLFISSPADVSAERRRAALVVERLNGVCETLEGSVGVRGGDAVLTGVQGEH